jgi:hypothetical protein
MSKSGCGSCKRPSMSGGLTSDVIINEATGLESHITQFTGPGPDLIGMYGAFNIGPSVPMTFSR